MRPQPGQITGETPEHEISMHSLPRQENFMELQIIWRNPRPLTKVQRERTEQSGALYLVHSNSTQKFRLQSSVQGLKAHGAREHNFSKSVDRPAYSKPGSSIARKDHSRTWNTLICVCAIAILFAVLNIIELRISAQVTRTHSGVQRSTNGTRFIESSKGA